MVIMPPISFLIRFCNRFRYFRGTALLKGTGNYIIYIQFVFGTMEAIAFAAAIFISSVICFALALSAPLNIPGEYKELFIWLGKSASACSHDETRPLLSPQRKYFGSGFAIANIIGLSAMDFTISGVTRLGFDTSDKNVRADHSFRKAALYIARVRDFRTFPRAGLSYSLSRGDDAL